jgi:hypothetical protein
MTAIRYGNLQVQLLVPHGTRLDRIQLDIPAPQPRPSGLGPAPSPAGAPLVGRAELLDRLAAPVHRAEPRGRVRRADGPTLPAAAGSVLYLALIALLSLGAATAVRDSAAAIGVVLGLLYLFPIIAQLVTDPHWQRHLKQLGPMTAGLAIQATTNLRGLPISPWAGLGVLAAWAAAALLAGGLLLRLRDA